MTDTTDRIIFLRGFTTVLRPVEKADERRLARWVNDPDVRRFVRRNRPATEMDEAAWIDGIAKRADDIIFVIETLEDAVPIGVMGLHRIDETARVATTGAVIGEKAYWGKGFGTDAKMHLLNYAFNQLNLRKICSNAYDFNGRSIAYSKKCGYEEEGRLRAHVFADGGFHDLVQLAVFRDGFERAWASYRLRHEAT